MSSMIIDISREFISVGAAAAIMGCTVGRVRQMLRDELLDGQKINERAWIVSRKSAEAHSKKPEGKGRPRVG